MKAKRIIECVPNFSEGRSQSVLDAISKAVESCPGVKLLHVDPGASTNRTVFTFAGEPEDVIEAAFCAIRTAAELIDMRQHKGAHPRMGATDVCPLVPVSGISLEETNAYALKLAERVGSELQIPVYLYEASASAPHRKNLADIRSGEYEGLEQKMQQEEWIPDFGPRSFQPRCGATVIGARDFLVAYNVNLNTKSVRLANEIAFDIRENGRPKRDPETQKILKDENGEQLRIPGTCPGVKAIGWYIDEYGMAQISMNLTRLSQTPLHIAFEECRKAAEKYGLIVTGSELVGLVPKSALTDAGRFYLQKQGRSLGVPEEELIHTAILSLGLNSIQKFEPEKRIIEYMLTDQKNPLVEMNLRRFAQETASENPAPGGGSVSAYVGALGAALSAMVGNLTAHKKGYEDRISYFSEMAEKATACYDQLLNLVDEDTRAFNSIIDAFRLPKTSPEEKKIRKKAIRKATIAAIEVPLQTMKIAAAILPVTLAMVREGNPNSITDAGVGALCIEAAVKGAGMNVKINAASLDDEDAKLKYFREAEDLIQKTTATVREIIAEVENRLLPF